MIRPKKIPLIQGNQFAVFVVLTIALFLFVDYGQRTTAGIAVTQSERRLEAEIEVLEAEQEALEKRLAYVKTPAFVEWWARQRGHMMRPGDHPFFIVPAPSTPADSAAPPADLAPVEPTATNPDDPPWHQWWRLFFDTEPGTLTQR